MLNPPYRACPHCGSALGDEHESGVWIETPQGELEEQLAKEEAARKRAEEEALAAEGAFPMLSGQVQMPTSRTPPPPPTTRTVLSLNSDTKKVMVSSYTTPMQSRPASRGEDREEDGRVPRPLEEVSCAKERLDPERPWKNVAYLPLH